MWIKMTNKFITTILYLSLYYDGMNAWQGPWISNTLKPEWLGKWFPYPYGTKTDQNPIANIHPDIYGTSHPVMGVPQDGCDDGKTNLHTDWYLNPINFTCFGFGQRELYRPKYNVNSLYSRDIIPAGYIPLHKCMDDIIEYDKVIPSFGYHRPLWAKYGEYTFLPKQRWLHNMEHGSLVMLYHPCADMNEVELLKHLVRNCLYRHIITPYNLLSSERPLALVAWGNRLEMSKVHPELVVNFIKLYALKGPEQVFKDGQYSFMLKRHAEILNGDISDRELCKQSNYMH